MEILQLPLLALEERIEQKYKTMRHPIGRTGNNNNAPVEPQAESTATTSSEQPLLVDQKHANKDDFERSYDWSNEYPDTDEDRRRSSAGRSEETSDRYFDTIANMEDRPVTLFNHLHDQLANYETSPDILKAADKVIFNLDANGYLPMPLDELVDAPPTDSTGQLLVDDKETFLNKQKSLLESGLHIVQTWIHLVSVAVILKCLLLGFRLDTAYAGHIRQLIQDHLEDLAANRRP